MTAAKTHVSDWRQICHGHVITKGAVKLKKAHKLSIVTKDFKTEMLLSKSSLPVRLSVGPALRFAEELFVKLSKVIEHIYDCICLLKTSQTRFKSISRYTNVSRGTTLIEIVIKLLTPTAPTYQEESLFLSNLKMSLIRLSQCA